MSGASDGRRARAPGRAARVVHRLRRTRAVRTLGLHPAVALPGYWFATAIGVAWGAVLGGFRVSRRGTLIVCEGLPRWAFGRGGTTVGAAYLTRDRTSPEILEHEEVHREQWRRYGLALIPLYVAAGRDPHQNRFEIEAGLEKGGYRRSPLPPREGPPLP